MNPQHNVCIILYIVNSEDVFIQIDETVRNTAHEELNFYSLGCHSESLERLLWPIS